MDLHSIAADFLFPSVEPVFKLAAGERHTGFVPGIGASDTLKPRPVRVQPDSVPPSSATVTPPTLGSVSTPAMSSTT